MKKQWTELELTIVYYVVKHGVHGAVRNKETGQFLNENEIIRFLDHGTRSYMAVVSKFRYVLGIPQLADVYTNATKTQKSIVEKYANTTVAQMRVIINKGLEELKKESNDNTLENDKSSLEPAKASSNSKSGVNPGEQLSLDFDFDTDFYTRFS